MVASPRIRLLTGTAAGVETAATAESVAARMVMAGMEGAAATAALRGRHWGAVAVVVMVAMAPTAETVGMAATAAMGETRSRAVSGIRGLVVSRGNPCATTQVIPDSPALLAFPALPTRVPARALMRVMGFAIAST